MVELGVPTRFRPALISVSALSDDAVNELAQTLEAHPDVLTSRQAAVDHASKLQKMPVDEGLAILDAVVPLMFYMATNSRTTEQVLKELKVALTTGDKSDVKLPRDSLERFQKNIVRFLELSSVALKAKALSIAADCQRLFSEAKVLSDLRPVFGSSVKSPPLGAVVTHTLRISYAENGEEKDFFVVLDAKDLTSVQECIARALDKNSSLLALIESSKLQVFDTSR
jgi:hypothetical protein